MTKQRLNQSNTFFSYWKRSFNDITVTIFHEYECDEKGVSRACFYGDVINKARKVKFDTSKLVQSLDNLISKGYNLSAIVDSLRQDYYS